MKKLIIFDLDGTLLYTLEDLKDSANYALSKFSYPTKTINEIKSFVGNGVAKLIQKAIPDGINNINYSKCLEIFKKHYKENMYNKTCPYNDIINLLSKLKEKGYKIAICSNKFDLAVKELSKKYFPNLIDFAIGENEKQGIKKKPNPDMVEKILTYFNLSNDDTIFVGDSEIDILTAKNSSISSISVCWGYKAKEFLKQNNATIIIDNPFEILKYIN